MSRGSMTALITSVSGLIGDAGHSQFTVDQVQDALDATREEVSYLLLEPHPTMHNSSATTYALFVSPTGGGWETDYVLYDSTWAMVTNDAGNETVDNGRFLVDPANTDRFLYICGKQYDIYAAAGALLDEWAAALKAQYDLQTGAGVLGRHRSALSQKYGQTAASATAMWSRARVRSVSTVRRDIRPGM